MRIADRAQWVAIAVFAATWGASCGSKDGSSPGAEAASGSTAGMAASGNGGVSAASGGETAGSAGKAPAAAGAAGSSKGGGGGAGARAQAGDAGMPAAGAAEKAAGASGGTPSAAAGSGGTASPTSAGCSRDFLKAGIDSYFGALEKHDASSLPQAPGVKLTENGMTVQLGEGLWKTAGAAKLKRSALDTETCSSVTESVVTENGTDIVVGLRLKYLERKLSEIESIVVRKGDYTSNPMTLLGTASDDWETVLPTDQQSSRETLSKIMDMYFTAFPMGGCMFASDCVRYENGFTPGKCSLGLSCSESGAGRVVMKTRLIVADVDAGIVVGFTMFQGQYTDFHMFKVRGGQVHGVHATLAKASGPGW